MERRAQSAAGAEGILIDFIMEDRLRLKSHIQNLKSVNGMALIAEDLAKAREKGAGRRARQVPKGS